MPGKNRWSNLRFWPVLDEKQMLHEWERVILLTYHHNKALVKNGFIIWLTVVKPRFICSWNISARNKIERLSHAIKRGEFEIIYNTGWKARQVRYEWERVSLANHHSNLVKNGFIIWLNVSLNLGWNISDIFLVNKLSCLVSYMVVQLFRDVRILHSFRTHLKGVFE